MSYYYLVGKSGVISEALQKYCSKASVDYTLTDSSNIRDIEVKEHSTVIYLSHKPRYITRNAYEYIANNLLQILTIFCDKKHKTSKIIYISTSYVFGSNQAHNGESDLPIPQSIYGLNKLLSEILFRILVYCGFISSCRVFRSTKVIESLYPLFETIECSILARKRACIYDDSIYPISAEYLADLLLMDNNKTGKKFSVCHVCGQSEVKYTELAKELVVSTNGYREDQWENFFFLKQRKLSGSPYLEHNKGIKKFKIRAKCIIESYKGLTIKA